VVVGIAVSREPLSKVLPECLNCLGNCLFWEASKISSYMRAKDSATSIVRGLCKDIVFLMLYFKPSRNFLYKEHLTHIVVMH
jgi:hypothetical protein